LFAPPQLLGLAFFMDPLGIRYEISLTTNEFLANISRIALGEIDIVTTGVLRGGNNERPFYTE